MKDLERKTHYKMYKSHKGWLVAGITVTSLAVGIFAGPQATQTAKADDGTPATEATSDANAAENASQVTLSKSDAATKDGTGETDTEQVASQGAISKANSSEEVTGAEKETASSGDTEKSVPENETVNSTITNEKSAGAEADGTVKNNTTEEKSNSDKASQEIPVAESDTPLENAGNAEESKEQADAVPADEAKSSSDSDQVTNEQTTKSTTVNIGVAPQDPTTLTDPITGKDIFNIKKDGNPNYTFDHTDGNGISSDLRVVDGYDANYQITNGYQAWMGETHANSIALTAKGEDPNVTHGDGSHAMYIDEWMPDYALQNFIWQNNFAKQYATINDFRANFTKADLANLTNITTTEQSQQVGNDPSKMTLTYQALMSMRTLEGLQNATNLESIYLYPNVMVSLYTFGTPMMNGNLWDIRALSGLKQLKKVDITLFSVNDITALADKPNLTHVGLSYNQVTDISPLATDENLDVSKAALGNQHVLLKPITLGTNLQKGNNETEDGTLAYTTPSFIIKDWNAANLPVRGFNNDEGALYPSLYPSTSDSGNVNSNTIAWYNLLKDSATMYGGLSSTWADTNSSFGGYIIQPYALDEQAASLVVNVQLLQADGNQLELGPSTVLTGEVGDTVSVNGNPTITTILQQALAKGYTYTGLTLDGTGMYSDYIANNGKANLVTKTSTVLTKDAQNWTMLFAKDVQPWHVDVFYGYQDDQGNLHQITDGNGNVVTDKFDGTDKDTLETSGLIKDFPDYVYQQTLVSTDNSHWSAIDDSADVPFLSAKQSVLVMYAQAKRATVTIKDATTGETVQTLDYTTNPELRGAIGTTSSFDSATVTDPAVAKGYVVVSDTTKNADGTSAIVFTNDDTANLNFVVTLAHAFNTVEKAVQEQITYQDTQKNQVADPTTKTITFATVTDQVTNQSVTYSKADATSAPTLDVTGKPTDAGWTVYQAGDQVAFDAVQNPMIKGMHVVKTTDPANDLTQVTEQAITSEAANLAFVVTYAHDFTTDTKQVTEGITYVDESGKQVAEPVTKTITFVTVTDQSNDQQTVYSNPTAAQAPELDENGKPTDAAWTVYQAGDPLTFEAVANPKVTGMHVIKTTDPANDLTQTTAQTVTGDSADLAFVVTYAADSTGGGGNPDPGNPDPETPDPGNPDPENPDPENPDPETPDPGNPGGGGSVTPEVPSTGGNSSGSAGDQGTSNKKPNKVTGGQNAGAVNNGGSAATGQPGMTAAVTTGGHAAKVDLAANTAKQPAQATSQDTSDQLPQTNEQANNGLAVVGLALLGALAGAFGWKKRQD